LFHAALENTFKLRNAAVADPEEIRKVANRRAVAAALVRAAFDEHRLDALAYPTLRRRPVVVEEPQRGTNCQLSATTGWPAMAMPAGFTADGVPIGFELLGPAWSDQRLVAMAYAYEQAVKPRRPAPTKPALVNGAAPGPVVVNFGLASPTLALAFRAEFDPVSGRLTLDLPASVVAASIHRGAPGIDRPVLHRLIDPASPSRRVTVVLPPYQRPWLIEDGLYLAVQTAEGRDSVRLPVGR
jgi:amidase